MMMKSSLVLKTQVHAFCHSGKSIFELPLSYSVASVIREKPGNYSCCCFIREYTLYAGSTFNGIDEN